MFRKWWWIYSSYNDTSEVDLHDQKIFSGLKQMEWGDCGTTFIVDADNGVGG